MIHGDISSSKDTVGVVACPGEFHAQRSRDPEGTRKRVEAVTRDTVGNDEAWIDGIPNAGTVQHG